MGQTYKKRVGVIIACRMKSQRLKHKATLQIGQYTAIERCILNCKKIRSIDEIILATSGLKQDHVLKQYAIKHGIRFFTGHPKDVIQRFIGAAEKFSIDTIIRITGDCPVVSFEIAEYLLKSHRQSTADYTTAKKTTIGLNSEIYELKALKRVINHLGSAPYSEYMTWYMKNNPHIFELNIVNLPHSLYRDYRLTLDEQVDLDMFTLLFKKLGNKIPTIKNIYAILDADKSIAKINVRAQLKYISDKKLIRLLNRKTKIHA